MHTKAAAMTPKIVFFDIDDTLYRKYTDTLRPSVAQAMQALKARGILTAIATGRPPVAFPAKIRALIEEAGIDLVITINGQYIEYRGEVLETNPLQPEKMAALCQQLDSRCIPYAFVSNHTIAVSEPLPQVEEAMAKILPEHPTDKDFYRHSPVYQMLAFYPPEQDAEIAATAAEQGYQVLRWHETAVDLLDQTSSKARGIQTALAKLGIDMADVMAFGDGYNDVEMLKTVGFGVAMGNGVDAAKAAAKHVCPSVDEDGVYRGLQELGVI